MTKRKPIVVATSGGFDPVHIGHVRMFEAAKRMGDKHIVILNNDNWLVAKKGYAFMPQKERKEVLAALRAVDEVILTRHPESPADMSIAKELRRIKPDIFANGGDRKGRNDTPESRVCEELGIEMVFKVGRGGKVQSSSWLVDKHRKETKGL